MKGNIVMDNTTFKNNVIKRDGSVVNYNRDKIKIAILKAINNVYLNESEDKKNEIADNITLSVENVLKWKYQENTNPVEIEVIQDTVEHQTIAMGF
jgi:anaerobic ribonucleoside-triphosphate reductase